MQRTAEIHFEAGYVPSHHSIEDFAQAIRAIGEPIHDRPADEISMAKLLTLLFEVTRSSTLRHAAGVALLQKTMVVAEGVARTLDPSSTCGRPPSRGARVDRAASRADRRIEDAAHELAASAADPATRRRCFRARAGTWSGSDGRRARVSCFRPERSRRSAAPRHGLALDRGALWVIAALIAVWDIPLTRTISMVNGRTRRGAKKLSPELNGDILVFIYSPRHTTGLRRPGSS